MLLKSGAIVAVFTLLSRLFGLARELFIAATFGSTAVGDCVNIAFKFPNLFRRIFGEGALSVVFIPIFNDKLLSSKDEARIFSGEVFSLLMVVLLVITILMQILMPYLMFIVAPGFFLDQEKFELAVILCRITMPYLIFVSGVSLFGGMLNSIRKFAAFAFVPVIMNCTVIIFTYVTKNTLLPEFGVAYALLIAGILQLMFMFFCLWRNNLTFPVVFAPQNKDVRKLIRNMGPATLSSGAQQLNLFISQSIASFIPGAVSILSYADRLYQLPLAFIGISFGTVLLPELSKIYKQKQFEEANNLQNRAIQIAAAISIPATVGLIVLCYPIIHIIYERGEFLASDTLSTSRALAAFSLGLPAYVLAKILIPIYYANHDTKTPLKITIYTIIVNTILNVVFMIWFGEVGIAVGSSIASWFNVYLLNKYAKHYGDFKIVNDTISTFIKVAFASLFMGVGGYFINDKCQAYLYSDSTIGKILCLAFIILASIALYIFILAVTGAFREIITGKKNGKKPV